jgi:hypothetical protein
MNHSSNLYMKVPAGAARLVVAAVMLAASAVPVVARADGIGGSKGSPPPAQQPVTFPDSSRFGLIGCVGIILAVKRRRHTFR